MRLRVQLTLAFLLLAVVPLTGLTVYNYFSSIQAYRQAVREEAGALAQDMGVRMESMRADVTRRIGRLGSFPFRELMANSGSPEGSRLLMNRLRSEIGDAAPYIDSLEITPPPADVSSAPSQPPPRPPVPPDAKKAAAFAMESARRIILHVAPLLQEQVNQAQKARQPGETDPAANPDFRIVVEEIRKSAEALKTAVAAQKRAGEVMGQTPAPQPGNGRENWAVQPQSGAEGSVTARVRYGQFYRSVLSHGRRRPNDIPFVIDEGGKLHCDSKDETKLTELNVLPSGSGVKTLTREAARQDWVVVKREDEGSKVTLGVARPIGEGLASIRYTAARNLVYGLGMVGVALIGILPLSGRMTRNLSVLTRGADQLSKGDLQVRVPVKSRDEFGRLAEAFNRMAHELGEHQKQLLEQERLRSELEMSRKIQQELLPRHPLTSGFIEVQGVSIPARQVGGDFFNYFALPGGETALLIGDVSGKGIAAALLMANIQATLEARLPTSADLAELAGRLDNEIADSTPPEVYLTLFMAVYDGKKGTLRYVNAGHHPQLALFADGNVELLESTGRPLGLLPDGPYTERTISFGRGDSLFLYTDGLIEAENPVGEPFGMNRLRSALAELRGDRLDEVLAAFERRLQEHRSGTEPSDDVTMMMLNVKA